MRENGPAALFNERPCGGEDTFRVANNRLAMCEDNAIEVPLKDPSLWIGADGRTHDGER